MRTRKTDKIDINKGMSTKELKEIANKQQCYQQHKLISNNLLHDAIEKENEICNPIMTKSVNTISHDEAYVWGMFFAEGTCDIYTFSKSRTNI